MNLDFRKILLPLLLFLVFQVGAQSVKELETQRKQALKQLESTNKMLNETKKSQKSSLNKLTIINNNINERKNLIKSISSEIVELDTEVDRLGQEKRILENRLISLKKDYARLIQESSANRSVYSKIMFVLSAETFDQSYRRLRYLGEFQEYRKAQVRKIESVKVQIAEKSDSLNKNKETKVVVVKQKEVEAQNLTKDEKKVKLQLNDLKKKEGKLRADLKVQQRKAADLNNKIANYIAAEIKKADAKKAADKQKQLLTQKALEAKKAAEAKRAEEQRKQLAAQKAEEARRLAEEKSKALKSKAAQAEVKAAVKAEEIAKAEAKKANTEAVKAEQIAEKEAKTPAKETNTAAVSALTKEESLVSGNFAANQGRLPWPTANGFISGRYGVQAHAVLKHVTTNNKGIYIQTPAGSSVRAVFEGKVTQIFYIQGNNGIIIQHGNYRTVYANLSSISVHEGQTVSAKQTIGRVYTDTDNDNKTELYFQIYNGRNVMNPESWIAR